MAHNFDTNFNFGAGTSDTRSFDSLQSLRHPIVALVHLGFRGLAIFFYVFANFISESFIVQFLLILALFSADFWAVKNVTGRLLVGLRWWNIVDSEGKNHWKFESSKNPEGFDPFERRIFWGGLIVAPVFWVFLVSIAFLTLKWQWMVVALLGFAMTFANLYGYLRCKWNNAEELSNYVTKWAFFSMLSRTFKKSSPSSGNDGSSQPTFNSAPPPYYGNLMSSSSQSAFPPAPPVPPVGASNYDRACY